MNITNLPLSKMITENGDIAVPHRIFFNQLINQLQTFLSDERYKLPDQPTDKVNGLNNIHSEGGIVYDNSSKKGKINTDDGYNNIPTYSFKTIVTYEELTNAQRIAIPSGQRNGRVIFETDTGNTVLGTNNGFITL